MLSNNLPTRAVFEPAAVLTGSSAEEIAQAVATTIEQCERFEANARDLQETFRTAWQTQAAAVWDAIQAGAAVDDRR